MRKMLKVDLCNEERCYTELTLPATPYTVLDALEKLQLDKGAPSHWVIADKLQLKALTEYLDPNGSFFELNALCQQLSLLNERQLAIVEGLVKMECSDGTSHVPLPRFIDIAYSTDCCYLVDEATDDYTLGRFCAENGFVPEADDLSDRAFELLDFSRIGREFRQNEGGVFTAQGYVQRFEELKQVYSTLTLALQKPDYAALVQTASGCEVKLPFPLGETVADEPVLCVDCAAPALIGMSSTMRTMDMLAHKLTDLTVNSGLAKYKAVLQAADCDEICWALDLADRLDEYTIDPKVCDPGEVVRVRLAAGLSDEEMELILPLLSLYSVGKDLLELSGGKITSYGLINHIDGQTKQTMEQGPKPGGMEMM